MWEVRCPLSVGGVCQRKLPAEQNGHRCRPCRLSCRSAPPNALHIAAGQEECENAVSLLEEEARKLRRAQGALRLMPVPLYAGLPAAHQLEVFEPSPRGYRKVRQAARATRLQSPEKQPWAHITSAQWLSGCHLVIWCPDSH